MWATFGRSRRWWLCALTRCRGPLWYTVAMLREEFIFAEAAVLVGLEVFVRRHALHQPTHGSSGRLQNHTWGLWIYSTRRGWGLGWGGVQLHEIEDHDEDKTISKLRTVDLWPAWHTVNELSKVTRHHITVLMLLNTQASPPFPHHKELCTHTLSALLVSKTNSSFGLVADGEQCNTLAQIAPYKWFTFFPPLSL